MITYIFLVLMGLAVIVMIQKNRSKISHLIKNGARTEGTVIGHSTTAEKNNNTVFPIIQFITNNQQSIRVASKEGFLPGRAKKGKKLSVIYDPTNPQDFTIELPKEKLMYITVLCGGILFMLTGILLILNQLEIIHLFKK
jgi:Protein of unknown function (DUF3592)